MKRYLDETRPHAVLRARLRAALVDVTYGKSAAEIAEWTGLPVERAAEVIAVAEGGESGSTEPLREWLDAASKRKKK